MTPFIAELIGTTLLIFIGVSACANVNLKRTKGHRSGWIVVTTAWALGVFIGVVVASPYSGAHLNPAITIGLATAGQFAWSSVLSYIVAQLLGGTLGALLAWIFYYDHFNETENPTDILGSFCTLPAIPNTWNNLFSEVLGAFVLAFVGYYVVGGNVAIGGLTDVPVGLGSIGAIPTAFTVWVIGLALGGTTGYAINPARDLAPRIVHSLVPIKHKGSSNWSYAWIPVVGPIMGALLAALLYMWIM